MSDLPQEATLLQLFEYLLVTNVKRLDLFSVKVSDEMKDHLLVIMKEHGTIFGDIEKSIKKIVADNKINSEDIPELLVLVGKIYELFYKSKHIKKKWDYYELIKCLLHISFVLYLHDRDIENKEMLKPLLNIIESAIDLIKLKSSVKPSNFKLNLF